MAIAVIIPAYNEEKTVKKVVREFRQALPEAAVYVGDNNSHDRTAAEALEAGAKVIRCEHQGKGNAVRKMIAEIDADIYVMIDADDTYSASNVRELIEPVRQGEADMVVGARKQISKRAFSYSHKIGNVLLTKILNRSFNANLVDILSGYRVMSRRLADDLIMVAEGFEIEAELTIRTLRDQYKIIEIPVEYSSRPQGSHSKLSTFGDGFLILYTIITLFRDYNPMVFFFSLSSFFFLIGLTTGSFIFVRYLQTGAMYHVGLAVLTALSILLSSIIFFMGLLLDSLNNNWRLTQESMRRNRYLLKKLSQSKND